LTKVKWLSLLFASRDPKKYHRERTFFSGLIALRKECSFSNDGTGRPEPAECRPGSFFELVASGGDQARVLLPGGVFAAGPIQQVMGKTITRGLVIGNRTGDQGIVDLNRDLLTGAQCVIVASQHRPGAENCQIFTIEQTKVLVIAYQHAGWQG
jgi:hypothetical protein